MSVTANLLDDHTKKLYGDPFFDLSNFYMPKSYKKFFKWTRFFFMTNAIVGPTIVQMAVYPVTNTTYSPVKEDQKKFNETKNLYKMIFEDVLRIKSEMIQVGIDYFTYGNAFVMVSIPFRRMFKCPVCDAMFSARDTKYKYNPQKATFSGTCKNRKCKKQVTFRVEEKNVDLPKRCKIVRLYPGDINIRHNPITGESQYHYKVPGRDSSPIKRGNKFLIDTTPMLNLKAIAKNSPIKLDPEKVFHFKRPNVSGVNQEWGMPLPLPALKKLFYMQILQKAQEAVAIQHIVPLVMLYPEANAGQSPYELLQLDKWRKEVEHSLQMWKKDPNYVGIFPFPVGSRPLFGNGRSLLVTAEVREAANEVVAGMGVTQEFVFGGLTWSASSITLRMLENQFLNYRGLMLEFLRFVVDRLVAVFHIPRLKVGLQEFKMIDDVQQKQFLAQLREGGLLSDETLLNAAGRDYDEEYEKMKEEVPKRAELTHATQLEDSKINAKLMIEQAKAQAVAAVEGEMAANEARGKFMMSHGQLIQQWATQMENLPPAMRQTFANRMQIDMPTFYQAVAEARGEMAGNAMPPPAEEAPTADDVAMQQEEAPQEEQVPQEEQAPQEDLSNSGDMPEQLPPRQ